jgi:class 3 adenylate cyclase
MWQLVINGPGYFDTAYDLPEGVTQLGRADENDVVLSGDLVSRKHARLHVHGETLTLEDLGSRNGCRLRDAPVMGSVGLSPGDVVAVGENTLLVRQPSRAEAAATEMVDTDGGGAVRRFGRGVDIREAVLAAKDLRDSQVMRVLDNLAPFDLSAPPVARRPSDTDDEEAATGEHALPGGDGAVAVPSLVLLYRVAECLATAASLQEFLDTTCDLVMKRVNASTGVVLTRHATGVFVPRAVRHAGRLTAGEVPVSDAIVEAALQQGQAIAVADVRDDQRFASRESVVLYNADQVLCVPVGGARGEPFAAVLYLNRPSRSSEPLDGLLDVCTAIAQLLATGLEKFQVRAPADDRLRSALERYHAPDIVERRVAELEQGARLTQLEERTVTVLFADIAGLTTQAQKLPADTVVAVLNEFYRLSTQLCFSFEGTVDKFLGDAVMALFGAPYQKGDDAIRAVRAAIALKAEWERAMLKRPVNERFRLKVGLNTGKVLAGTIGSEARLDYTAIGEPVNVAAWLCTSAEPGQILLTGKTLAVVGARFDVTPLGERLLQGARVKSAIFEVTEEDHDSGTLSGVR